MRFLFRRLEDVRRVALIGNGLSVAANNGYALGTLTAAVRARLAEVPIGTVSTLDRLDQIVHQMEIDGTLGEHANNFERLLGPIDRLGGLINVELSALIGSLRPPLLQPLLEVGHEVRALYIRGVGAVLSEVDTLDLAANLDPVRAVVHWIVDGLTAGDLAVIHTLNYDPLLDRVLLEIVSALHDGLPPFFFADEFSGQNAAQLVVVTAAGPLAVNPLRGEPWRRDGVPAVDLVHLHGGQHWIRTPNGIVYKAAMNGLRGVDAYGRWLRDDPVTVQPSLILTDQKGIAVTRSPFAESYRRLREDLAHADRVAILGYGFGDKPLNKVIREAWAGPRPANSRWLINHNAADYDEMPDVLADTADALATDLQSLPPSVFAALPAVANTHPNHFEP